MNCLCRTYKNFFGFSSFAEKIENYFYRIVRSCSLSVSSYIYMIPSCSFFFFFYMNWKIFLFVFFCFHVWILIFEKTKYIISMRACNNNVIYLSVYQYVNSKQPKLKFGWIIILSQVRDGTKRQGERGHTLDWWWEWKGLQITHLWVRLKTVRVIWSDGGLRVRMNGVIQTRMTIPIQPNFNFGYADVLLNLSYFRTGLELYSQE